jgi:hypothetical protein
MDSKRAEELLRLLEQQHRTAPEGPPAGPPQQAAAAPIYLWLGIEPPPTQNPPDES